MARAFAKAESEMAPGSWLVSLEFEVPGVVPAARVASGRRSVFVYRIGRDRPANSASTGTAGRR